MAETKLSESVLSNRSRCREELASVPRLGKPSNSCSVFQTEGPKRRCPSCERTFQWAETKLSKVSYPTDRAAGKSWLRSLGLESRATVARSSRPRDRSVAVPVVNGLSNGLRPSYWKRLIQPIALPEELASVPRLGKPSNSCSVFQTEGPKRRCPRCERTFQWAETKLLESVLSNRSRCREELASVPRLGKPSNSCSVFQTEGPKRRCPRCERSFQCVATKLLESVLSNRSRCREELASVPRLGKPSNSCSVFQTEGPKRRCPVVNGLPMSCDQAIGKCLIQPIALPEELLRSLGLESRATVARSSRPRTEAPLSPV